MVAHISCDVVKLVRGLSLAGDSIRVETWRGGEERNTHQLTTCTTNGYDKERIQTDRIQIDRIQTDRQTDRQIKANHTKSGLNNMSATPYLLIIFSSLEMMHHLRRIKSRGR